MDHIFLGFFFSLQISQTFFLFPFSWEMGLICNRTLIFHLYYGFFLLPLLVIIITPHIVGRLPFFLWLSYFFHRNFIALVRDRIGQDRVKGGGESSDVVLGRNEERSLAKKKKKKKTRTEKQTCCSDDFIPHPCKIKCLFMLIWGVLLVLQALLEQR